MANKTWTEEDIVALLQRSNKAVERAVLALHRRQTMDERQTSNTHHDNHVGFRKNHAPKLSYFARLIGMGNSLYPAQLELARKWCKMYRRQLCDEANSRVQTSMERV
jgi:hypothetical protein